MADQLDEYRKRMQSRYQGKSSNEDEEVAKKFQDEENARARQRLLADEEIARKLQNQYDLPPPNPQPYVPPVPSQSPYQAYPVQSQPIQYPAQNQPPLAYYPPPPPPNINRVPQSNQRPQRSQRAQPAPSNATDGCLPTVEDKCCGINTQYFIIGLSITMTIGIIASLIALSAT